MLVDANVLMYAAGAVHPHKAASVRFLGRVAESKVDAVVDAEVLQEVLHRYRALRRWSDGRRVYDLARRVFAVVLPITGEDVDRARELMDEHRGLMARDALHCAIAERNTGGLIVSFDRDLDVVAGVHRIEPDRAT
ncbi:MAG: type II toxin-antitoxin system VapC family toxin [bacterium]